jgi:antitoxin StbD
MNTVLSTYAASVSALKRNPSRLLDEAEGEAIAILNHNKPTAYLVPAERYEEMMEALDDLRLAEIVQERAEEKGAAKEVNPDEL